MYYVILYYRNGEKMNKELNGKYLNNGSFYLTCNDCERLIGTDEMTEEKYDNNDGYCYQCQPKQTIIYLMNGC